ncbi:MAG: restriction endonuclease subunit S [Porphyromonas sp.]|nr:restriction endonuclease subunit S [Porphyromonas sp.]
MVNCPALRFPEFSDEWQRTTLGEVVRLPEQIEVSSPKLEDILSVKLHGKGIARTNATTLQLGATKYYIRKQGQLIYGKQNFHNGAIALVSENYDNGITSKDIPSFDLNRQLVAPLFLLSFLLRTEYYTAMEVYTTGTGSKRLKEDVFFNLPVSFPSLVEQEKIAAFLSLIDERIEVEERLLRKYEEQKRYLLQQMFV